MRCRNIAWLLLVCLGIAATIAAGSGWIRYRRWCRLIDAKPQMHMLPEAGTFAPPKESRTLDLGYAVIAVPSWIRGPLAEIDSSGAVGIETTPGNYGIAFMWPAPDHGLEQDAVTEAFRKMAPSTAVHSLFDLEKRALQTRRAPWHTLLLMEANDRRVHCALLLVKMIYTSSESRILFSEAQGTEAIIRELNYGTMVTLHDCRTGNMQVALIAPELDKRDEIIGALINGYRPRPISDWSRDAIRGLIADAGIASKPAAPATKK